MATAKHRKSKEKDLLTLYREGLESLHKKRYEKAREIFLQIREKFPDETEVMPRVHSFLKVCEARLMEGNPKGPRTPEEFFDMGVFLHNDKRYDEALECYARALKESPNHSVEHIYYAMAATEARLGETDRALEHLKKAIELRPENRFSARNDPDLEILLRREEFQQLVGSGTHN